MYSSTSEREFVKTELEYRLNRIQNDLAGRRRRRTLARRSPGAHADDWNAR